MSLIKCSECGKEISDKATTCPNCGAPIESMNNSIESSVSPIPEEPKKSKKERKKGSCLKTILIVFGVLIVLSVIGNIIGGGNDKEKSESAQTESDANMVSSKEDSAEESDDVDIETVAEEEISEEPDNIFYVGDVADTGKVNITFLSAEEYTSDNQFMQPKDGNIYYRIGFEVENTDSSDTYISSFDWECYADGYSAEQTYFDDESIDATLSPGKKTKGYIFFEVPSDAKEVVLEYETNFWTENKIIFVVK